MAIGSIKAIKELGLEVPDDISVIGFDNIEMASYMTPELTTIEASLDKIAKQSVKSLIHYYKDNKYTDKEIIIPTDIVCRQSVKPI